MQQFCLFRQSSEYPGPGIADWQKFPSVGRSDCGGFEAVVFQQWRWEIFARRCHCEVSACAGWLSEKYDLGCQREKSSGWRGKKKEKDSQGDGCSGRRRRGVDESEGSRYGLPWPAWWSLQPLVAGRRVYGKCQKVGHCLGYAATLAISGKRKKFDLIVELDERTLKGLSFWCNTDKSAKEESFVTLFCCDGKNWNIYSALFRFHSLIWYWEISTWMIFCRGWRNYVFTIQTDRRRLQPVNFFMQLRCF